MRVLPCLLLFLPIGGPLAQTTFSQRLEQLMEEMEAFAEDDAEYEGEQYAARKRARVGAPVVQMSLVCALAAVAAGYMLPASTTLAPALPAPTPMPNCPPAWVPSPLLE